MWRKEKERAREWKGEEKERKGSKGRPEMGNLK